MTAILILLALASLANTFAIGRLRDRVDYLERQHLRNAIDGYERRQQ